ncbi:MAG: hypothetical protein BAJALOKI3v1_40029 [Promethearchaeota archaeon]|nr:MAG: hypothetical protein BAJALOKI3v1_40029 [Candidatus Lokiarchaeota archaeon]
MSKKINMDTNEIGYYSKLLLSYSPKRVVKYPTSKTEEIRVLRVICQRPYYTGSGINHVNLLQKGKEKGIKQASVFGHPVEEPYPLNNILDSEYTYPITFFNPKRSDNASDVPFPVPGMSDEMPYESTTFSRFDEEMLEIYLEQFANQLQAAVSTFQPNIIHSHHLWLVTSLCRVLFPEIPLVATCHNTALRQMELAPQLRDFVKSTTWGIDAIAVIDEIQQKRVEEVYDFNEVIQERDQFFHIGQGINTTIFSPPKKPKTRDSDEPINLIYVGKLNYSKGVPQLIRAFKEVAKESTIPLRLNIIGSGQGPQKEEITSIGKECGEDVCFLGQLDQETLAKYFRKSDLFVLPSFYDGLPKVLLEALSSGCRAIITDLPGIQTTLINKCGPNQTVQFISMPEMKSIDEPLSEEIPEFVENLKGLIKKQISAIREQEYSFEYAQEVRRAFGWDALFQTYIEKYRQLLNL